MSKDYILVCEECYSRNYKIKNNKVNEVSKFCNKCNKHTLHKLSY